MIGKFNVVIDGLPVKRISRFQAYKFARTETRVTSFAGTDCVDRSSLKYKVSFNVAICTDAEMQQLVTWASGIVRTVTFPDGGYDVTKTMILDMPNIPEPHYKYGKRNSGIYYTDIVINMEEV